MANGVERGKYILVFGSSFGYVNANVNLNQLSESKRVEKEGNEHQLNIVNVYYINISRRIWVSWGGKGQRWSSQVAPQRRRYL